MRDLTAFCMDGRWFDEGFNMGQVSLRPRVRVRTVVQFDSDIAPLEHALAEAKVNELIMVSGACTVPPSRR